MDELVIRDWSRVSILDVAQTVFEQPDWLVRLSEHRHSRGVRPVDRMYHPTEISSGDTFPALLPPRAAEGVAG